MIEVSQNTDAADLLEMKNALNAFINRKDVADWYANNGKEEIELYLDRKMARELLVKVTQRLQQLNRPATRRDAKPHWKARVKVPSAR